MEPLSIAALGFSALGAVSKWFGSQEQAKRIRAQRDEQARRQQLQNQQVLGQATAAGAASGVEFESTSLQQHLSRMRAEMQSQLDWNIRAGTDAAQDVEAAGTVGAISDLGGSLFSFGSANNWWRKPAGG